MTAIEWTDETWNPVTGCDRVSAGCDHCYALTLAKRLKGMGQPKYQRDGDPRTSGPGFGVTQHRDELNRPLRWRKPRRVFVNSMSDLFHPEVDGDFIVDAIARMALARRHTFQVLTKRPQRMARLMQSASTAGRVAEEATEIIGATGSYDRWRIETDGWTPTPDGRGSNIWQPPWPLPNVWLGTSAENQRYADLRIPHLMATPARTRFLSIEPLLGPIDLTEFIDRERLRDRGVSYTDCGIDWVIVGGESGPGARPMHPDWVRDIRDQCIAAGVPFFFKQWGAWSWTYAGEPTSAPSVVLDDGNGSFQKMWRTGKKVAGRVLDGRTWDEMPGGGQ